MTNYLDLFGQSGQATSTMTALSALPAKSLTKNVQNLNINYLLVSYVQHTLKDLMFNIHSIVKNKDIIRTNCRQETLPGYSGACEFFEGTKWD